MGNISLRPPIEPSLGSTDRTLFGFQRPIEASGRLPVRSTRSQRRDGVARRSHPLETGRPVYESRKDRSSPRITQGFVVRVSVGRHAPSGVRIAEREPHEAPSSDLNQIGTALQDQRGVLDAAAVQTHGVL